VLRAASERESAAFLKAERALQLTRPRIGARGLESFVLRGGRIERDSIGRLRFRFNGWPSDFEAENAPNGRRLSPEEVESWSTLRAFVLAVRPKMDAEGNLVSMKFGPRVLRRLPTGRIITIEPNGMANEATSVVDFLTNLVDELGGPPRSAAALEAELLASMDEFLPEDEDEGPVDPAPPKADGEIRIRPKTRLMKWGNIVAPAPSIHGPGHVRAKLHRCPLCATPVKKGRSDPLVSQDRVPPGGGSIRDLRGGFLSRLRETYLVKDPASVLDLSHYDEEPTSGTESDSGTTALEPESGPTDRGTPTS
jgi:hypothetical protein